MWRARHGGSIQLPGGGWGGGDGWVGWMDEREDQVSVTPMCKAKSPLLAVEEEGKRERGKKERKEHAMTPF